MPGLFGLSDFDLRVYADGRLGAMSSMSTTRVCFIVGNVLCSPQDTAARIEVMTMMVECAEVDVVSHWYKRGCNILLMFLYYQHISPA